ncbi:exonuclease domain-containing protein [Arenibacter sp. M-2]|uniref:exonuclease domain-containing protein n=1 Tax=Arenibacter sp. M-2 TaxID=3053612 RepID=UPI0025701F49|nr:exonuclease domain-containing protein [Arenibacter sp. M-2]MDL5512027.1 exonuclease domain-containing protein [Arenibacter sp. M-2]
MYAIIETETTGLRGEDNKITEICILIHDGEKIIKEFSSLVNPEVSIKYRVSRRNGINNDKVRSAPKFYELAKEIVELTKDCIFISHHVNFNFNGIKNELASLGAIYKRKKISTLKLSRKLIPGQQSYSLGAMCNHLGINVGHVQSALDKAKATVGLLEKLWDLDTNGVFNFMLGQKSGDSGIPPLWPKSVVAALPNITGVYYFKNAEGKIIYVGKAKDIKQRVLSHVYSKAHKEMRLCFETVHIDYTHTGSELVALLLESDEIKKHLPKFNRAQKRIGYRYGIGAKMDKNGITNLFYDRLGKLKSPLVCFYNQGECRSFLEELCETYELCSLHCNLQQISGVCFHFHIKKCHGICLDMEPAESYNKRVEKALMPLTEDKNTYLIKAEGRNMNEKSVIMVEKGVYKGFGFLPKKIKMKGFKEYDKYITPMADNNDVQKILKRYLRRGDGKLVLIDYYQKVAANNENP